MELPAGLWEGKPGGFREAVSFLRVKNGFLKLEIVPCIQHKNAKF